MVATGWHQISADPIVLLVALTDRLPGSVRVRASRAEWIADTVSRLTDRLNRPASFMPVAAAVLSERMPVSTDELAQDRDALLGAIADMQGPLDAAHTRAWTLAIGLFAEIVSSVCLDPFAYSEPADQTVGSPPLRLDGPKARGCS